jgi:hypothetical protein
VHRVGAGSGERGAGSGERGAGRGERGEGSREQGAGSREQRAESREQGAGSGERGAGRGEQGEGRGEQGAGRSKKAACPERRFLRGMRLWRFEPRAGCPCSVGRLPSVSDRDYSSSQPWRYSFLTIGITSGAFVATSALASHSIFLPSLSASGAAQTARLPSRIVSVSPPA